MSGMIRRLLALEGVNVVCQFRDDGSFVARQKTDGAPIRTPVQTLGAGFLVQTSGGNVSAIEAR